MYYITTDRIRRMHMRVEELLHQLVTMKANIKVAYFNTVNHWIVSRDIAHPPGA